MAALDPEQQNELIATALELAQQGQFEAAIETIDHPEMSGVSEATYYLGLWQIESGRPEEAMAIWKRALDLGDGTAGYNLGVLLEEQGNQLGAFDAYLSSYELGDLDAGVQMAFIFREDGKLSEADSLIREVAEKGSDFARGVSATWRWDDNPDPRLEDDLRAGLPFYPSARTALSFLMWADGRVDEARSLLEEGCAMREKGSYIAYGNLLWDEYGDLDKAEESYRRGITAGDAYCHYNLATLLLEQNRSDEARTQLAKAIRAGDPMARSLWEKEFEN